MVRMSSAGHAIGCGTAAASSLVGEPIAVRHCPPLSWTSTDPKRTASAGLPRAAAVRGWPLAAGIHASFEYGGSTAAVVAQLFHSVAVGRWSAKRRRVGPEAAPLPSGAASSVAVPCAASTRPAASCRPAAAWAPAGGPGKFVVSIGPRVTPATNGSRGACPGRGGRDAGAEGARRLALCVPT